MVKVLLPSWTNTGFEWDAVFDKWTGASLKKSFMSVLASCPPLSFLVTPAFPPPPSLRLATLSPPHLLPPAQWGTSVCHERSYPLDLASGVLIYFISHRFSSLCHFFYRPLPPFHRHLSSYPQNHFHLSFHTNILTEFLLGWREKKEWKKQESKGMGRDRVFHQSKLWEIVHKQIEKYRYASE